MFAFGALLMVGPLDVCRDELGGGDVCPALIEEALGDAAFASGPLAGGILVEPCRTNATFQLLALVAPEGFVERLAALLADKDCGGRIWC